MNKIHKNYCKICHSTKGLKSCSKCKRILYCSKNCQKIDWRTHKSECDSLHLRDEMNINLEIGNSSNNLQASTFGEARQQQNNTYEPVKQQQTNQYEEVSQPYFMFNNDENMQKETLTPFILDNNNSELLNFGYRDQPQSQSTAEQQTFEDELFEQLQSDLRPENQQFLKETKDNLEKQLSMFNETYLKQYQPESEQKISEEQEKMGISGENFLDPTKFDENFLYR